MKKYGIICVLIVCFLSCENDTKVTKPTETTTEKEKIVDGYLINGTTVKANGQKISLYEVHPNDSLHLVTTTTVLNNQFKFTGKVENLDFYLVKIDSSRKCKLLLSNSTHEVLISDKSYKNDISSDNYFSNSYALLHYQLNKFRQGEYLYRDIYKNAVQQNNTEKIAELNEKLAEFEDFKRRRISSFVTNNREKPLVALIVKDQIDFLDLKVVKQVYDSLPSKIQSNTTGKFIANYIEKKEKIKELTVDVLTNTKTILPKKKTEFRPTAYTFSGKTIDGSTLSLPNITTGNVILIDFWASWCQPCRVQSPHIVSLYKKYKDRGLVILSISEDTNETAWVKAIENDHFTWNTHIIDVNKSIAFRYGIEAIPHTVLIDKNGKIAAEKLSGNGLEAKIKQLLNE
ncbi:TlpA disulfide reductase family protein [uncultured Kordia sp.]|uniref:TlpA family protein disulfide reductase n=1 Tax=uncultured Kordia sp. TaxID=507699 RepID=UPI002633D1CA|nr:TlpA disulfide reductase family protein [uncultured Kordia sp.]